MRRWNHATARLGSYRGVYPKQPRGCAEDEHMRPRVRLGPCPMFFGVSIALSQGYMDFLGLQDLAMERREDKAQCEVCGNEYDKAFGTSGTHLPPTLTVLLVS